MGSFTSRGTELDVEQCVENAGGNRFDLIIAASQRAREIKRRNQNSDRAEHLRTPMTALLEIQEGKISVEEYLKK